MPRSADRSARPPHLKGSRRLDPNRFVNETVLQVLSPWSATDDGLVDLTRIDRERLPEWIASLRESETQLRGLRTALEAVLADSQRQCEAQDCNKPVTGRSDRRYCGATCRQRARRRAAAAG